MMAERLDGWLGILRSRSYISRARRKLIVVVVNQLAGLNPGDIDAETAGFERRWCP